MTIDIMGIHKIPAAQGKTRPVIAKFKNLEVKVKIMKNRSKDEVKKDSSCLTISCNRFPNLCTS